MRLRRYTGLWLSLALGAILLTLVGPATPSAAHGTPTGDSAPILTDPAPPVVPGQPLPNVAIPAAGSGALSPRQPARNVATDATTDPLTTAAATFEPGATPSLDLRVLVISADGTEPTLGAIKQTLDFMGTPYDVWVTTERPGQLSGDQLAVGSRARYNAVLLTTGNLAYTPDGGATWLSGLTTDEWQTLWNFQAAFKVRLVSWYTFPTADYGYASSTSLDTGATPYSIRLTTAGRSLFTHLNPNAVLGLRYTYAYPAALIPGDPTIRALITDTSGRVFAATRLYPDGRENLSLTFSGNEYLFPTIALGYGLVNWATRGLFIGEFRTYIQPQVDDYFIENDIWTATTPCGTNLDLNPSGVVYRMRSADVSALVSWQNNRRNQTTTRNLRLSMAFNGTGADPESAGGSQPSGDTLVSATSRNRGQFFWVNHTYEHLLLNDTAIPVSEYTRQLQKNHDVARRLAFNNYSQVSLVTPEISGLNNQPFLDEAYRWGIRYMVSDASRPEQRGPGPNQGYRNPLKPGIMMIPRKANNLFYNVSRPDEWVAEYNCLYEGFWGRKLTMQEIIDKESDLLAGYMLRGDISPWMFHQANLRFYDGRRSLLTDLIDATLSKYNALYRLPVQSLNQHTIGQRLERRAALSASGVAATLTSGQLALSVQNGATVPITGICTSALGATAEVYNGQCTLPVTLSAGGSATLTVP